MTAQQPAMSPHDGDVAAFIAAVEHEERRSDSRALATRIAGLTGEPATMWGPTIIGFGTYHYVYESGREGDAPLVGFSPRAQALAVYLTSGYAQEHQALLARLGPHRTATACVYVKRLADIDLTVLDELVGATVRAHRESDRP